MFDAIIRWSLSNRLLVLALSVLLLGAGLYAARMTTVDVFPDLTAPSVTVMTEAPGLATEEVEQQINFPIETSVSGAADIRRVRSLAVPGFSIVWVEFEWGTDIVQARQTVTERLAQASGRLPPQASPPVLGPITSIMGEIEFFGVSVDDPARLMAAREIADWELRPQLLAIPGIAQVTTLGGEVRQYQVLVSPDRLREFDIALDEVTTAVSRANRNAGGGWISEGGRDYLIRFLGRTEALEDLRESVVAVRGDVPVLLRHVAAVQQGAAIAVGDAGINGKPGVMVAVLKQPQADTLQLTEQIAEVLARAEERLPEGLAIEPGLFRQADFINTAIANVSSALRDGALFVVVVLFLFLLSVRTTLISTLAIPLALAAALLLLWALGIGINTMTLGGLTIAIGALVDDAIIFVENIFRRLKENRAQAQPRPVVDVVFRACSEVRQSVVFSTAIIMLVFAPLFVLSGVEGRLLAPLGLAYLLAIAASLLVALTVTPVLSAWLLPRARGLDGEDSPLIRWCKRWYTPLLGFSLRRAGPILAFSLLLVAATLAAITQMGRSFLPEFNEGSLTIAATTPPGTSLETSAALGRHIEELLLALPEVRTVGRKSGRAEEDEHTQGPNVSEFEVTLGDLPQGKEAFLEEVRDTLSGVRGVSFNIGQPLSHRIDHMLSGTRASIAVKVFGPSLPELERIGGNIERIMQQVDGTVDVAVEPLQAVPQLRLRADREAMARYGVSVDELAQLVGTAYGGVAVSQVLEGNRRFDLVVRFDDEARSDRYRVGDMPIRTPTGDLVPLRYLAPPSFEYGPGMVLRENAERRLIVSSNVAGRDLRGAVDEIRQAVVREVELPSGYRIEYGGQFEAEEAATRTILWVSLVVLVGILLLLQMAFQSLRLALLVMVNIPLALVGGVAAVFFMGGTLTVAALVGFITLFGIAVRNGILLIARYQALTQEGLSVDEAVRAGSLERLAPILMTALTAGLALIPLALGLGEPGTEIQAPMAVVILGGLITSTLLNMVVVPALYRLTASPQTAQERFAGAG
ncbi:efflux RND transporter permease subunit [Alkalilimnicola ehrlichii]|uniref:CusA/CzcA family heavy metal efflux RND transporter n=1 Tax=Alkalilimnicola ehrlichii TaxID=351052 RepID=A0A3E0WKM1_9GAMM|nr:efflux RND transporter permease subunit [Alkalilimnicola ehrlichii]RFA32691.1 CusA/CzcA family heavy metal efflux RND transporter [Alkalilimnicola ehrlichii]